MQEKKMYMWPSAWNRPSINGTYGAISSNNVYATQAGLNVLRNGGNAFDAAVADPLSNRIIRESAGAALHWRTQSRKMQSMHWTGEE